MNEAQVTKRCSSCKEEKPLVAYACSKNRRDGLQGICRKCQAQYRRTWNAINKAHVKEYRRKCYAADKQKHQAMARRSRLKHKDKRNAEVRKWHEQHPAYRREYYRRNAQRFLEYNRQRRLRALVEVHNNNNAYAKRWAEAPGSFTPHQWQDLCNSYNCCCAYCGRRDLPLTRHHVVPLSKGGTHFISNLAPACQPCNSRIGTRTIPPPPPNSKDADTCRKSEHSALAA